MTSKLGLFWVKSAEMNLPETFQTLLMNNKTGDFKLMKMEQKGFFQAKTTVFSTGSNTMIIEQKGFFKALFTFKR